MKKAGCLMPVSALPSNYGIGDLGSSAYEFIDILSAMGMKIWQILPLNPLGFGNSPYQAHSSFAGDEIYISLDKLVEAGLLSASQVKPFNSKANSVDYTNVRKHKEQLLKQAFKNFNSSVQYQDKYQQFINQNDWLDIYAVFIAFKKINNLNLWTKWPDKFKNWIKNKQLDLSPYSEQINYEKFIQFIFYWQWEQLKTYANSCHIEIMGDIPIYLGLDSADVWSNQELFLLDEEGDPTYIAGVPPDSFSKTGQRWGNPLYNWEKLEKTSFSFWLDRLHGNIKLFDIIRIDHFRAFDTYWKVPASCKTAIEGEWVEAPGYALFDKIYQKLPGINIVAEDLGDLRPQVYELRDKYNLPGMKLFQDHFNLYADNKEFENAANMVIYTGTHDNTTLLGWYSALLPKDKQQLKKYFNLSTGPYSISRGLLQCIISYLLKCSAKYVVFPIQDIIGLDKSATFNRPGTIGSPNWEWKLTDYTKLKEEIPFMARAIKTFNR